MLRLARVAKMGVVSKPALSRRCIRVALHRRLRRSPNAKLQNSREQGVPSVHAVCGHLL